MKRVGKAGRVIKERRRGVIMEQMMMFGLRGSRVRIRKDSPICSVPGFRGDLTTDFGTVERTPRGGVTTNADPCKGCPRVGVANCLACIEAGAPRMESGAIRAQSGEADGCLLALVAMVLVVVGIGIGACRPSVQVRWIKEYPYPVCERCGRALDGATTKCAEEGEVK